MNKLYIFFIYFPLKHKQLNACNNKNPKWNKRRQMQSCTRVITTINNNHQFVRILELLKLTVYFLFVKYKNGKQCIYVDAYLSYNKNSKIIAIDFSLCPSIIGKYIIMEHTFLTLWYTSSQIASDMRCRWDGTIYVKFNHTVKFLDKQLHYVTEHTYNNQ